MAASFCRLIPLLKILGLILLSVLANSSFLFLVVSFFRTTNAFATASTILGTLIGFVAGIYVQIGILPVALQTLIKIFPISHVGLLMRRVMMEAPMSLAFAGAPAEVIDSFKKTMGAVFYFGEKQIITDCKYFDNCRCRNFILYPGCHQDIHKEEKANQGRHHLYRFKSVS